MFKKTIKIFPAPHVEVRLHVSKEMVKDFKACCDTGLLGYVCGELCSKTQADSCEKVCENCKLMNYVEQLKEAYERDYRK